MATCKDCVHYDVCRKYHRVEFPDERVDKICCQDFKDISQIIELLCRVGDKIHRRIKNRKGHLEVVSSVVKRIEVHRNKVLHIDNVGNAFTSKDFGKTVFLTKAEAEKANLQS